MSAHQIAVSRNNKAVYARMVLSNVAPQLARQPRLVTLLNEVVQSMKLTEPKVMFEHDMGRQIGYEEIIETREKDTIFYARLLHSQTYTRFVKHRKTEPTQFLSGVLVRDDEGNHEITDLWLGKLFPPAPDTEAVTAESKEFWENHALVYNGQQIIASTQTYDCPY